MKNWKLPMATRYARQGKDTVYITNFYDWYAFSEDSVVPNLFTSEWNINSYKHMLN